MRYILAMTKENFLLRVEKTETCWLWNRHVNKRPGAGYGHTSIVENGRVRGISAHRLAYILFVGPIPSGMQVLHSCDVRHCVRPDHLFIGTQKDNMADMIRKGREVRLRGTQFPQSKLTEEGVLNIRSEYKKGLTMRDLARMYKVSQHTIMCLLQGKTWKHI